MGSKLAVIESLVPCKLCWMKIIKTAFQTRIERKPQRMRDEILRSGEPGGGPWEHCA